MTKKFNTRCWFCNSTDLEPDERGMLCKNCGAAYNLLGKPGMYPQTLKPDPAIGSPSASPVHRRLPLKTE